MTNQEDKYTALARVVRQLMQLVAGLILFCLTLLIYVFYLHSKIPPSVKSVEKVQATSTVADVKKLPSEKFWNAPADAELENHPDKEKIMYGKSLVAHTSEYFGNKGSVKKIAAHQIH